MAKKDIPSTPLADRYRELCDEYLKAFCEKQGLPYEHYYAIGDMGGVIDGNGDNR